MDPLSEDYVHNSTYAFSENKVTAHVELEGLEAISAEILRQGEQAAIQAGHAGKAILVGSAIAAGIVGFFELVAEGMEAGGTNNSMTGIPQSTNHEILNLYTKDGAKSDGVNSSQAKKGNYSHLKEPKNVADGAKTTSAQRKRILEENKKQNGGQLKSDGDGRKLNQPKANKKGEKADMNQAEVDHKNPKSKGGSNSNSNQRVISKEENLIKGNRTE